jgi:deoxyadenosine/deoxycytidine kinase
MAVGNYHIGIMGNLFSGKTTLMNALTAEPYRAEMQALLGGAEIYSFTERVEKNSLTDRCLKLFYEDRVANIFATEVAFLHMRVLQQREIRHLLTRESRNPVVVLEDRPFLDGPEVFVRRMIDAGEMPKAHSDLYYTLFYQTLHNERIRLPDLTVYLRTEPTLLEKRRKSRAKAGDAYAKTISFDYLKQIHDRYETLVANWRDTLRKYQELTIVPSDSDVVVLPAEIDMDEHPDYVHVAAGTIREKVRRMIAARRLGNGG